MPVGLLGALLGWAVRWVGLTVRPIVHRSRVPVTVGLGALIGLTAMAYQLITGNGFTEVLFSGQDALPNLVATPPTTPSRPWSCSACARCWRTACR